MITNRFFDPHSRNSFVYVVAALTLAGVACQTNEPHTLAQRQNALSTTGYGAVAWEETDGATVTSLQDQLPLLEGRGIALALHWHAHVIDDPARWALVDAALARGIQVQPWLLLPEADGYFPNSVTYAAWIAAAEQLVAAWEAHALPATAFIVDMEMSKDKLHEFQRLTAAGDPSAVVRFLEGNINREEYAAASDAFVAFVDDLHARGHAVNLTTLLPMLDDYADGDDFLRQSFSSPIDAAAWDEVSFQLHRTIYAESYPVTSHLVYDYGVLARRLFGERAGVGIGLTHAGIAEDPDIVYASGDALRADTEAALAAGFPSARIGVYSFLGMYSRAPTEQWFQDAEAHRPFPDFGTGLLHTAIQLVDALGR
ncbi:MAG: hypothetical protein ABW321_06625 [Polyangiales bacterium]